LVERETPLERKKRKGKPKRAGIGWSRVQDGLSGKKRSSDPLRGGTVHRGKKKENGGKKGSGYVKGTFRGSRFLKENRRLGEKGGGEKTESWSVLGKNPRLGRKGD